MSEGDEKNVHRDSSHLSGSKYGMAFLPINTATSGSLLLNWIRQIMQYNFNRVKKIRIIK